LNADSSEPIGALDLLNERKEKLGKKNKITIIKNGDLGWKISVLFHRKLMM